MVTMTIIMSLWSFVGMTKVNGANVIEPDGTTLNGVIHAIDSVLGVWGSGRAASSQNPETHSYLFHAIRITSYNSITLTQWNILSLRSALATFFLNCWIVNALFYSCFLPSYTFPPPFLLPLLLWSANYFKRSSAQIIRIQ